MSKFISNPGSPYKPIYSASLTKDGHIELKVVGQDNIQEYIDSFADETDINWILARCTAGDTSVLSKRQGSYGDFVDVPKNYHEFMQKLLDGQEFFDSLPVDLKNKFDNSFEVWMTTIGSKEWFEAMKELDKKNPIVDDEVIKE